MKKRTKDVLNIVGMQMAVVLLFVGLVAYAVDQVRRGEPIVTNWLNFHVPVVGSAVVLGVVMIVLLVALPRAYLAEQRMTKAEKKKRRRQKRNAKRSYGSSDLPWQ